MTTQSIIVYRNPAEAMLWEGGYVFPLIAGLGAGFLTFVFLMWALGLWNQRKTRRARVVVPEQAMIAAAIISIIIGGGTFHWLFI